MGGNFEHLTDSELEELRKVFYSQAHEITESLQELLVRIEKSPDDETLQTVKRHIHTLKGDSNSFGLTSVGGLCHGMEDIIALLANDTREAGREMVDLLLDCTETISVLLSESESGSNGNATREQEMTARINAFVLRTRGEEKAVPYPDRYTEYQQLQMQEALQRGLRLYEIEVLFHPMCKEKGLAAFMVTERLNSMGHVIRTLPDVESSAINNAEGMEILFASSQEEVEIRGNASIVGITSHVRITEFTGNRHKTDVQPGKAVDTKDRLIMIESSKVDMVMNFVGELIIGRSILDNIAEAAVDGTASAEIAERLLAANTYMERTVSDLQKSVMKMRMVPVNHVFRKFPKIVRDLTREKGKPVRLEMHGRETELDRGIVEALGEPLAHIVRNIIDHGIEDPEQRKSGGKSEEGVIMLGAYHEAAHIVIEVSDDGRGIDAGALREKAVEEGFINRDDAERLSESSALELIFLPGLSTSATVDEVSGRGIGMSAVKSAVEGLRGAIEVESTPGKGTTFRLRLPLTLAVIKALLFDVGGKIHALPVSSVSEVARITPDNLATVDGRDTLMLRDRIVSLVHLNDVLGISGNGKMKKFALILAEGGRTVGLVADRLLGQQELVIKAVESPQARSELISGASILGDGKVVLILDASALLRKAVKDERQRLAGL